MYLSFDTVFELNSIVESPMGNEAKFVDHAKAIVDNEKMEKMMDRVLSLVMRLVTNEHYRGDFVEREGKLEDIKIDRPSDIFLEDGGRVYYTFTEAEIKQIDERYWAFAVPVEMEEN